MEEEKKLIEYALNRLLSNLDNETLEELTELLGMDSDEVEDFLEELIDGRQ